MSPEQSEDLATLIRSAARVAVLTGAGISTGSGIPDFRGPNGVWTKDPEAMKLSDIHYYMNDPEIRVRSWKARLVHPVWQAQPNQAHEALVAFERKGHLSSLATQNIDGLHQMAGSSPEVVIELHGTAREVMCMSCGERAPMQKALDRVRGGEKDPSCRSCSGILKSATVSFGQMLDENDLDKAFSEAELSDLYIAIGTTLTVEPSASLPIAALRAGARLVIINAEPTPLDRFAEFTISERVEDVLPRIAALL